MSLPTAPISAHPGGEPNAELQAIAQEVMRAALPLDTVGRRFHVEWDPLAPVTPMGQLVFFPQFLAPRGFIPNGWLAVCN